MSKPTSIHFVSPEGCSIATKLRIAASAAGLLLLSAAGAQAATVSVEGGAILGAAAADGAVTHYLGVPFAAAPIAGLRWRPPQPVTAWEGVLETVHAAPACPQPLPPPGSFYQKEFFLTSERQSEDCLYLNLWTPARTADEKLPVMVWFYGGGFVQGSGSLPSFDGEALARHGVIVVTINYRLGPLGFLAFPALDQESPDHVSGNYGLLDMIAALRWVQNNVGGFGGDPGNVTIFGQSAGAFGVNAMMASPLAHGLFQRAIVESYQMFGIGGPTQSLAQAEEGGAKYVAAVGATALSDLRMIPSTDLVRTMGVNAVTFGLRPNVDGHVLPHDLPETIGAHRTNAADWLELRGLSFCQPRRPMAWRPWSGDASAPRERSSPNPTAGSATRAPPPRRTACWPITCSPRRRAKRRPSRSRARRPMPIDLPGPRRDRTRSRSALSILQNSPMCSALRLLSTDPGPIAIGRYPTRSSNTGRISPRPGIRTAPVCRSGRATGPRRMTSWASETRLVRYRPWTRSERLRSMHI